jgi:protein CpxP
MKIGVIEEMKKFARIKMLALVSLSSIVLVASVAFAQTAGTTQDTQEKARGEWRGHGKRGGHRGMRRGFGGGAGFHKLNLTEDQKARMKTIRESFGERTKSLREQLRAKRQELRQANVGGTFNEALAAQVLTQEAGLKAKLMGERFKLHQEMLTVLTAEQRTQLEQARAERKAKRAEFKAKRGERRATQNPTQNQ